MRNLTKTTATILAIALLGSTATSAMAQQAAEPPYVKQHKVSKFCHDATSRSYNTISDDNVIGHASMDECMATEGAQIPTSSKYYVADETAQTTQ